MKYFVLVIGLVFIACYRANSQEPRSCVTLNNQGVRALNTGHFFESFRLFELALRQDPDYPLVCVGRDSNPRASYGTGLQPVAFNHSATHTRQ
jgi:hypothetical protein